MSSVSRNGLFDKDAPAAAHVCPEIIDALLSELRDRVGSVTRAIYVSRIRAIARILAPGHYLSGLREIEVDLRYEARPRPKYHRIVSSERLLTWGLSSSGVVRRVNSSPFLLVLGLFVTG